MKVVLDSNVIVSACLSPEGNPSEIFSAIKGQEATLYLSPAIQDELTKVFQYEHIANRLSLTRRKCFLQTIGSICVLVEPQVEVDKAVDPDDNVFLETALEAEAQFIVSGDSDLTTLEEFRGIKILNPNQFMAVLESDMKYYLPTPPTF